MPLHAVVYFYLRQMLCANGVHEPRICIIVTSESNLALLTLNARTALMETRITRPPALSAHRKHSLPHTVHAPPPSLKFAQDQVRDHLPARHVRHAPQGGDVERARQAVGEAKEHHGRDPAARVLERKAALGHLVLLHVATAQVVHAALRVHLGLVRAGRVGRLHARQDVEVVVGRVPARVAFRADCCAEYYEVLGDACWCKC